MGRILAIDYGRKRSGIAVSDPLQIFAAPLTWLATSELLPYIETYCKNEEVDKIVLGLPLNLDGSRTDATASVESFAKILQHRLPKISLEFIDEQYSSKRAVAELVKSGVKKKKRAQKGTVDAMSAALILKDYLEKNSV